MLAFVLGEGKVKLSPLTLHTLPGLFQMVQAQSQWAQRKRVNGVTQRRLSGVPLAEQTPLMV